MSDHRRKTLRSFYCEEQLWQAFERRARETDVTIDQLLNDALRQFVEGPAPAPAPAPAAPQPEHATYSMPAIPRKAPRPSSAPAPAPAAPAAAPAPPPPPGGPAGPPPAPAAPPRQTGAVPAQGGMPTVYLHFNGRVHPVNKERFVIGRGSQGTDLTIRDGNISRKHAAVIFHSGHFYMQDLGSTNGIEFRGNRIDAKKIEEGDAYFICDHELTFSFRG